LNNLEVNGNNKIEQEKKRGKRKDVTGLEKLKLSKREIKSF